MPVVATHPHIVSANPAGLIPRLLLVCSILWWVPSAPASAEALSEPSPAAMALLTEQAALLVELQAKHAAAQKDSAALSSPQTFRAGAPPGTPDAQLAERRSLRQQLALIYAQHIDALKKLERLRPRVRDAERAEAEWKGFAEPAPYLLSMVDDLRRRAHAEALTVQGIQTRLNMIDSALANTRRLLKSRQEQGRQAAERMEGLTDPVALEPLLWARDLTQLHERVESARLGMLEAERAQIQLELEEAQPQAALLDRQVTVASAQAQFTPAEYQLVIKRLNDEQQALTNELDRAVRTQASQREEVAAKESLLAKLESGAASAPSAAARRSAMERTQAAETVDLAQLRYDNSNLHVDVLRQLITGLERERHIWDLRFAAAQGTLSVVEERQASTQLAASAQRIHAWKAYGLQQLNLVGSQITDVEGRLDTAGASTIAALRERLQLYRRREELYRRVLPRAETLLELIAYRETEFDQREQARSVSTRLHDWSATTGAWMSALWNVEIFSAEDTIEVDGKLITGRRSITLGKVLTALGMLIIGYWLAVVTARFAERQAIARLQVDPNVANIIRQWASAFLFLLLVILTLMFVKIPITAFAFLGGALAIGVGFGTQNLLKNVISGLLLLMERPLRVGDTIEVDGVHGAVTSIGLRSSTVRDGSGVETLIPNSHLLERNLTNWTYSSFRKRYALRVAVASGSDSRLVKDMLCELAGRHGQVLKEPEPYVLLDDFTETALVFTLHYWIDIGSNIDPACVASDLRFMIESRFAEAGILRK